MANREADFSKKTKSSIEHRCRNKCSNPDCGKETTRISSTGMIYSIGKACHIEAASPKGPRYNPESTLEQRKSIDNAIWLCSICAEKIDKDVEKYTTELLKKWKYRAERTGCKNGTRVFAISNETGGVGNSSVTAYLAQAFVDITNEKVLCVSVNANDDAGKILLDYTETDELCCDSIVETKKFNVDYMGDDAVRTFYYRQIKAHGRVCFDDLTNEYKYIFIDCGNGSADEKYAMFHMATDIIVPIGESAFTHLGIDTVRKCLVERKEEVVVWPVYSIGLTTSNKKYSRYWLHNVWNAINQMGKLECVDVRFPTVIIPKSYYMHGIVPDTGKCAKTRHVAEAYLDLANEILERT